MSRPDLDVSVSPHTDRQDVLILQTTGRKRWSVYQPPVVSDGVDPFRRGKDGDELQWEALGEPLLDVTLAPGDAIYVPLGFPHATTTASASCGSGEGGGEPSVHITVNLDSLIWGLSYRLLWAAAQRHSRLAAGAEDRAEEAGSSMKSDGLSWEQYSALQAPLPFGFLEQATAATGGGAAAEAEETAADLRRRAAAWGASGDEVSEVGVAAAMAMLRQHREVLLKLHRQMYLDVILELTDLTPMEKEMAHWQRLQGEMTRLRQDMGWEE